MKYIKGESTERIGNLPKSKLRLSEVPENIWIGVDKNYNVLLNHALAFFPCPSWGAMLPKGQTNLERERETNTVTLHPDAFESYIENKVIDIDGNLLDEIPSEKA